MKVINYFLYELYLQKLAFIFFKKKQIGYNSPLENASSHVYFLAVEVPWEVWRGNSLNHPHSEGEPTLSADCGITRF